MLALVISVFLCYTLSVCLFMPTLRTQTLHFSFLNADKHSQWMPSLLESCPTAARALAHGEEEEGGGGEGDEHSSPFSGRPRDFTGHVLALNGHKKYFCLFRPVFTGDTDTGGESSSSSSSSFDEGSRRKSRSRSRSQSSSRSRSREEGGPSGRGGRGGGRASRATSLEVHHKLDRLGLWMERLMEGTLPRYYIPAWPGEDHRLQIGGKITGLLPNILTCGQNFCEV